MSDRQLIKQLSELRSFKQSPALWREQTRARILNSIKVEPARAKWNFSEAFALHFSTLRLQMAPVPVMPTLMAILVVLFGSVPFVRAAGASLPGSPLYSLKRLTEQVQLSLVSSPEKQGFTYLKIAKTRLSELQKISPSDSIIQARLLVDYNRSLSFAQADLQATITTGSQAAQYDAISSGLSDNIRKLEVGTLARLPYVASLQLTDRLAGDALAMLVATHGANENETTPTAVAARFDSQIDRIGLKLDGIETKLNRLPVNKVAPRVVLESREAVLPAREASRQAKEALAQAKELVQKKEFTLALEKVQEVEDITNKTEAVVDKAEKAGEVKGVQDEVNKSESQEGIKAGSEEVNKSESQDTNTKVTPEAIK